MKAMYVVCAFLVAMNIVLAVALSVGNVSAQPSPLDQWHPQAVGSTQNMIAVMDSVAVNRGVLVVIDTQRQIMLSFTVDADRIAPMQRGGAVDLKREFDRVDSARTPR